MTRNLDGVPRFNMDRFHYFERKNGLYEILPIITRSTKKRPYCFLLGAPDPEMDEIEKLLIQKGEAFQHAQYEGKRAEPWNAYIADTVEVPADTIVVLIECEPVMFDGQDALIRIIDHHRPGDPGYHLPSEFFWEASSIGQLHKLLDLGEPKREHLVLAAMDHCVAQARLGNCPGIEIDEVKTLGIHYIAQGKGLDVATVEQSVRSMYERLLASPLITIGTQNVFDITSSSIGVGYSLDYLCLQEAIVDLGIVALIATKNRQDGPDKIIICGAATPETIRYFMESWAPANGLADIYGVPVRGYAGGYRP